MRYKFKSKQESIVRASIRNRYYCMISRCYNKDNKDYSDYGGRGITVCKRWRISFNSFYKWSIKNGFEIHLTLDRKNNNRNYTPHNCRYITFLANSRNKNRTINIVYKGHTKPIGEWCELFDLRYQTVYGRIFEMKWTPEKAFTTPSRNLKTKQRYLLIN